MMSAVSSLLYVDLDGVAVGVVLLWIKPGRVVGGVIGFDVVNNITENSNNGFTSLMGRILWCCR